MTIQPGTRLGPYEIVAPIGAGGMGEVYRARDARLGRDVAVKLLPPAFSGDPERLQRFQQEARSAAALNHPNILAVHDIGAHDGAPYIVSELLEGETLRERLTRGAIPLRRAIEYGVHITSGLAAAHDKGIVHRDLKPDNVFVTSDGRVKILDFGLAKLTHAEPVAAATIMPTTPPATIAGVVLGTAGYMAPEQVRGPLQNFPTPGGRWQVSSAGGHHMRWSSDGRELFYLTPEMKLMSVSVGIAGNASPSVPELGTPMPLFDVPLVGGLPPRRAWRSNTTSRRAVSAFWSISK
jgi:serine/threonine protein kinase